jgi:hypothetical protein
MFRAGLYARVSTNDQQTLAMHNRASMRPDVAVRMPRKSYREDVRSVAISLHGGFRNGGAAAVQQGSLLLPEILTEKFSNIFLD